MTNADGAAPVTKVKRRRARKACIPCQQRKRKCDAEEPCGMCKAYEYKCQYARDDSPLAPFVDKPSKRQRTGSRLAGSDGNSVDEHARRRRSFGSHASPQGSSTTSPHTVPPGVFDEHKPRYVGASSAIAFPRIVGLGLGSSTPPVLHSFGYNFGVRPEEKTAMQPNLVELISEADLLTYSEVFFANMGSFIDVLDRDVFVRRCHEYCYSSQDTTGFGPVAAGVFVLGSFLSSPKNNHPRELDVVQYAKLWLDDPASTRKPTVDHIVAWILRTFYLRATTRPNNSWIASCIMMHLAEAVGLHEEENILKLDQIPSASALGYNADRLRRIFWISWSGHVLTSYEYDRSVVRFRAVTCGDVSVVPGSYADQMVRLAQIIPSPNSPFRIEAGEHDVRESICERIRAIMAMPLTVEFLLLTRADVVFCFYRRLHQLKMGVPDEIVDLIITCGNQAVEASGKVSSDGRPFWNALSSVFQYACALLAMDTPTSLSHVSSAFDGLEAIVAAVDTRLTREALTTARYLLKLSLAKKKKEISELEAIDARSQGMDKDPSFIPQELPEMDFNIDWDQLMIDPYLSILGTGEM